jgi:hypothetical protein
MEIFQSACELGLKGCTVFREGARRAVIHRCRSGYAVAGRGSALLRHRARVRLIEPLIGGARL